MTKGYLIEEAGYDFNDEYYTALPDGAGTLASRRVYMNKEAAERACLKLNRGQVSVVLTSPASWAGYEGPLGTYLVSTVGYNKERFREIVDALLPPKEYPDLDRDSQEECAQVIDGINEWDTSKEVLTNARRDVLIAYGPEIFCPFSVVPVEIK